MEKIIPRRPRWRLPVTIFAAVLAVAGLAAIASRFYWHWQPDHLARQAQVFQKRNDLKGAALTAQRALQINNKNLAATRVMAEIAGKANAPEAVFWWQRVVQLQPGSTVDCLAWATSALRFGQPQMAEEALSMVKEADRHTSEYQIAAGTAAIGLSKAKEAAAHYAEALKLDPKNEVCQYNYATMQIQLPDAAAQKTGVSMLDALTKSERFRTYARRMLVTYFASHDQLDAALAQSRSLQGDSAALFRDRIAFLDLLKRMNQAEFADTLKKLLADAVQNPENAAALVGWMTANNLSAEAIGWAKNLKPAALASAPAGPALAQAYFARKDWTGLRDLVKGGNWGATDYLRLTYHARALRELGDENGFRAQWGAASTAAVKRGDVTGSLVRMLTDWGWGDEARELLWSAAAGSQNPKAAIAQLYRYYAGKDDTRGLLRVVSRLVELEPGNDNARNNVAMYSLLLKTNTDRAFAIARDLYNKKPADPGYASTYALALYRQKRTGEALRVMEALEPGQLAEPTVAAYYAVLLSAQGQGGKAAKFLELAKKAKLLPEEKELVNETVGSVE